jgi:predicted lipoprotein with Yx(FWY)xxD motif
MSRTGKGRTRRWAMMGGAAVAALGVLAAACGGTSSADKTKTAAAASAGHTTIPASAATSAATKAATSAATAATTGTAASGTPAAAGATTVKIAAAGSLGNILTDASGMTLYTFKNDVAGNGKSAAEALAAAWPPLTATGTPAKPAGLTGDLAVITRNDGKTQVTYKGLPLYFYVQDKAPGDTKGQGVGGVWFVAQP